MKKYIMYQTEVKKDAAYIAFLETLRDYAVSINESNYSVLPDFLAEEFSNFIQFMEEGESGESYILGEFKISIA